MNTSADWKAFLATLRAEGIPIGPGELVRLQQVFDQAPQLDREGLKQLLACTLVKDRQQRETFELLFEQWCPKEKPEEKPKEKPEEKLEEKPEERSGVTPEVEQVEGSLAGVPNSKLSENKKPATVQSALNLLLFKLQPRLLSPQSFPEALPKKPSPHRLSPEMRWFLALIVVIIVVLLIWLVYWWRMPLIIEPPQPSQTTPPSNELFSKLFRPFYVWMQKILSVRPVGSNLAWLPGILGIASSIFLWQRYRRRNRLPEPAPAPSRPDIDWLPWLKLESSGPELLNPEDLRTLVWGIGRFVSDEPTQEIDIDKTVAATANSGGIPELHYRPAVYQREVWLWQDAMTQDPLMERLVVELETALIRAGLPVRVGWFTDTPERIVWREGQVFSTLILEGHRQSALVVILTDGRGLRIADQSDLDKQPLALLLSGLAQWPQLTFVDVGRGQQGLAEILRPYGLDCIAPEGLPAFLGVRVTGAPPARKGDERLLGELRLWAAALALSPEAVDENEAFALRRTLGLTLPPWALRDVSPAGVAAGGRLTWSPQRRAELLNWLVQAEVHTGRVTAGSLLEKILNYWEERLQEERSRREKRHNDLEPWQGTLAAQRLEMEIALLQLWKNPTTAAETLYGLYKASSEFNKEIGTGLSTLAACDWRDSKQEKTIVFLPWREIEQANRTRYLLEEMGFARQIKNSPSSAAKLRIPSILPLAVGVCCGLGLFALGIFILSIWLK